MGMSTLFVNIQPSTLDVELVRLLERRNRILHIVVALDYLRLYVAFPVYHIRNIDGLWVSSGVAEKMVFRRSCHHVGMLTFGYILPRQVPVYNSIILHFISCLCIKF
jgi:hypothetical protein